MWAPHLLERWEYQTREIFLTFFSDFEQGGVCWMVDRRNPKKETVFLWACPEALRHTPTKFCTKHSTTMFTMIRSYSKREIFLTFFSDFEQGGVCWMVDRRRNPKKKRSSCEHLQRHLGTRLLNSALSTLLQCLHTSKAAVLADNLRLCHWEALWVDYYYIVWVVSTQYYCPIACPTQLASG